MKTNDYLILLATLAYSYLFYEQNAGVNFFIFSILLSSFCFFRNQSLIKQKSWIAAAFGSILSGFAVFYYGTSFVVTVNVISLILLGGISFNPEGSLFISAVNAIYSYLLTVPSVIIYALGNSKDEGKERGMTFRKVLLLILPLFVSLLFFFLYRAANPLFEEVTNKISLDFISVNWILFTLYGFLLMFGFFYQTKLKGLTGADGENTNQLSFVSEEEHQQSLIASMLSVSSEMFSGTALFFLLNLLLFSVNGIDVYYLYILQKLPDHLTLSQYLHDGTNALIVSILFAIAIILFFFRGRLNFVNENRTIRWLSYVWVMQNILLIVSTANRNWFYISNFGLTHKRLGVYVFLLLCVVGLVTSLMKVATIKSNWFLFRKNSWVCYTTLVFASLVNWDAVIASYNLNLAYTKNVKPDTYYLSQLSYTAMPVLLHFYKQEKEGGTSGKFIDAYLEGSIAYYSKQLQEEAVQKKWQSACLIKMEAANQISNMKKMTMNDR